MSVSAATLASPPSAPAPAADALAEAVLAVRKSDPAVRGRLMLKRSPLSKAAIPAPPVAAPAPLAGASCGEMATSLVNRFIGTCSQQRPAASTATLVSPAGVLTPPLRTDSVDVLVIETALPEQLVQTELDHPFNAPRHTAAVAFGPSPSGLPNGGSYGAGSSRSTTAPVPPASSLQAAATATSGEGCKEAPWEFVQSRRGMRRTAFAPRALKPRPPPPTWLHGRCHRCHEAGHWAAICREQLRCNNCREFGHKAKCCTGRTAPRPPPVQDRHGAQMPAAVHPHPGQRSPFRPQQQEEPRSQPPDVQLQSVLAAEAEMLRYELQGCLSRVENFLVRAEAAFGKHPLAPDVSSPAEFHVGSVDGEEACVFGCFSPRATPVPLPQPIVTAASESEDIDGVMTPVMKIMPELHGLCGEPASLRVGSTMQELGGKSASPMSMVHLEVDSPSVVDSLPPSLEPSQPLFIFRSETLFAKELGELLVSLEKACPGSGKEIAYLLSAKDSRGKIKKVKEYLKSISMSNSATRKASAAAC